MDSSKGRIEQWVEPGRLPPDDGFRFSEPKRMAPEDIMLLGNWIVKGELGLLDDKKVFCWVNQQRGTAPAKPVPAK